MHSKQKGKLFICHVQFSYCYEEKFSDESKKIENVHLRMSFTDKTDNSSKSIVKLSVSLRPVFIFTRTKKKSAVTEILLIKFRDFLQYKKNLYNICENVNQFK